MYLFASLLGGTWGLNRNLPLEGSIPKVEPAAWRLLTGTHPYKTLGWFRAEVIALRRPRSNTTLTWTQLWIFSTESKLIHLPPLCYASYHSHPLPAPSVCFFLSLQPRAPTALAFVQRLTSGESHLLLLWFHGTWCAAFVLPTFWIMQKSSLWRHESSANTAQLLTLLTTACWQIFFMWTPRNWIFIIVLPLSATCTSWPIFCLTVRQFIMVRILIFALVPFICETL